MSAPLAGPVSTGTLDWFGVGAAMGCALHCAAVPAITLLIPALGSVWLLAEGAGAVLLACSTIIAWRSLSRSYRRHLRAAPLLLAGSGIVALLTAETVGNGLVSGIVGGGLLAGAHLLNRRLCRGCPACDSQNTNDRLRSARQRRPA